LLNIPGIFRRTERGKMFVPMHIVYEADWSSQLVCTRRRRDVSAPDRNQTLVISP